MPDQLELFKEYKKKVRGIAGKKRANSIISASLYVVCAGSDDIANNYFLPASLRQQSYDFSSYAKFLVHKASGFVEVRPSNCLCSISFGCYFSQVLRSMQTETVRRCIYDGRTPTSLLFAGLDHHAFSFSQLPAYPRWEREDPVCVIKETCPAVAPVAVRTVGGVVGGINDYDRTSLSPQTLFGLQDLVNLGARSVAVVGIPPIGCVPSQRTLGGGISRACASGHNQIAQLYNSGLKEELQRLKTKRQGTKLVYVDIYTILLDMITHPDAYGKS
ncbi:hypothetical protein BHE74_00019488 [Ensete ventricosum]|nr:hypothetical protein GW17_00012425 [Ensete ventricosum]RWW72698.1 hypothetical protein BHE74_00019488 [Ensete ventricosum]RZR79534.1 hypothetical protein BHM03_00005266 [Ensete ventricosum]